MSGPGSSHSVTDLFRTQAPVVVTFDGDAVVDTFGDLSYFTDAEDRESLLRLLFDLLVGQGDSAPLLRAVELAPGKYADVHVVSEGSLRHLVLLDATAGVLEARELQQMKNEASLAGQKLKRELLSRDKEHQDEMRHRQKQEQSLRRRVGMLERISDDVRARLDALVGHARVLGPYCAGHPEAMRALTYIQRTAVHLEAHLLNYEQHLRENEGRTEEPVTPEPIALKLLAGELKRLFGTGDADGLTIEVASDAGRAASVEMDYPRVYQVLITLITLALDGADEPGVVVRLDTPGGDLLIGLDARVDWYGEGLDPSDMPQAGNPVAPWSLRTCRQLVRSMGGQFDIEWDEGRLGLSHVRILLPQPASVGAASQVMRPGRRAVVAIDDQALAATVTSLLPEIGLEACVVAGLAAFETAAREPGTGLVVLADTFGGEPGAGLVYRLHDLGAKAPVVLLSRRRMAAAGGGWQRRHRRVVVAADARREVLAAALRDAVEQGTADWAEDGEGGAA
jgi:signal transduction histidine kinase